MGIVATASLITAFVAGIAALFAPCCIGVLLPSYLSSIFKTKTKIFLMTFVYYLGLLSVFLPLGLGIASLGLLFSKYHAFIFTLGGLFMVVLGVSLVLGKTVMLPIKVRPNLGSYDFVSLYILGIFSGIATSCCAPVLAGVLTLAVLPGSWVLGMIYSLVFVTGLVLPLFVVALLVDRTSVTERLKSFRRQVRYRLFNREIAVNLSHLISGVLFVATGLFILIYERTNPDNTFSSYQLQINLAAAQVTQSINHLTSRIPEILWAVVFLTLFGLIAWRAYSQANANIKKEELK